MSAKSSIKLLMPEQKQHGALYKWVAILTGSKNSLKGAGFFIGGALLTLYGFQQSLGIMALVLVVVLLLSVILLRGDLGKTKAKPKFSHMFSKSASVNILSAARMFLFGSRDVWFVVALPVYFQAVLHWNHTQVGTFMALWIIGYGVVQGFAPLITGIRKDQVPDGRTALKWVVPLMLIPAIIALFLYQSEAIDELQTVLVGGLMIFGALFAINSSVHSFLILAYAREDGVSMDVGFYYMANAMGRLVGPVLSGLVYQWYGLEACLMTSFVFLLVTMLISFALPTHKSAAIE